MKPPYKQSPCHPQYKLGSPAGDLIRRYVIIDIFWRFHKLKFRQRNAHLLVHDVSLKKMLDLEVSHVAAVWFLRKKQVS